MKRTWKRALATLLTIAMMATLLVVPAAAEFTKDEYDVCFATTAFASKTAKTYGDEGFFSAAADTGAKTGYALTEETSPCGHGAAKGTAWPTFASGGSISFTPVKAGTATVYCCVSGGPFTGTIKVNGGTVNGESGVFTFSTEADTIYTITKGSGEFQISHIHWEAAAAAEPSIELDQDSVILNATNSTAELTATVANSTDAVTWTSSNEAVATVAADADDSTKATVTLADGVTSGTATITATLGTGEGAPTATCAVTVSSHAHAWDEGTVTTPATCTAAGVLTKTCSGEGDCPDNNTKTEEITALGHNTAENATAVADVPAGCVTGGLTGKKICGRDNGGTICQEVIVAGTAVSRAGHSFPADGGKCANCDVVRPDSLEITFDNKTLAAADYGYVTVIDGLASGGSYHINDFEKLDGTKVNLTSGHVKFDSAGKLTFKAPGAGTVKFYFQNGQGTNVKINGTAEAYAKVDGTTETAVIEKETTNGQEFAFLQGSGQCRLFAVVWEAEGEAPPATRAVTFEGDNATVSEVKQGETALTPVSGVYTANQTDAITFKVTADEDYEITAVKQGETTLTAADGVYTIPAGTEDAAITITATQLKTGTPAFSETEVQLQSKTDNKVALTLTSSLPAGTIYRLHPTAASAETMGTAGGVTASGGKITFNLKTIPTADVTYYVKAYDGNKAASEAAPITIKAYVPVTSVSLVHVGEQGDEHTLVGHVIYEKLNAGDSDVIGSAGNLNPSYPNGWKLVAKVLPDNATNKAVVFTNLKDTDDCIHVEEDGTVTAIQAGTGTLQVASVAESDVTADFEITVRVRIGSVEIQKTGADAGATQSVAMGETLALTANVTTSASGESEHKRVTWTSSDTDVATVSAAGVVTPKKAGTTTITATSTRDNTVKDTVEVTVGKGTPALTLTASAASVASGGTVKFNLEGVPTGVIPTFTVKKDGAEVNDVTVTALTDDPDGYDYKATMPTNESGANVAYTVTAAVAATSDWDAAEAAPVSVTVRDASVKAIHITRPGATMTKTFTVGDTLTLIVEAEVQGAGGVKDETATAGLTYAWTKDGNAISATTATYTGAAVTQADAGSVYVCTIASADANIEDATVTFTIAVQEPALASINVELTAAEGVSYTDGALAIVGPVDATLTIQTAPAGHGDTVAFDVDDDTVVNVDVDGDTLTVSPKKPGTTTVTLSGTEADTVTKVITVTVTKAPAPTPLTKDDITVTQPTTEGGKGTIAIKNPVAGTEYRYKTTTESGWHDMTGASVEVDPGTYLVRIKVDNPTLQNYNPGVSVEIKAFAAAPTVSAVAITGGSSVKVEGTLQLTAQVTMSDSTVSDTETVTWTSSDPTKATVSNTGLVTGVAEGTVTITATSTTDSTKKAEKTITVTPKTTTPTVDKAALNSAVTAAETALAAAVESVDGTDVPTTGKWITAADKATLEGAIADAKAVAAKADATQAEVNAAKTAVENAAKAIKAGTKDEGGETDGKKALTDAITAAEAAAEAVVVSADGTDVSKNKQWVTQEVKDAYAAAIAAAKAVAEKTDATQEELTQAVADLAEATTAFETAQAAGTKASGGGSRPAIGSGTTPSGDTTATNPDGAKVAVTTDKDGVTTAVVTVPSGVDKTTVTIPVAQPSNTLVPVIVNADGTEEIVRMSAVTEDGVALTLDKSATVKLVNNAKEFVDVPGHWAEKSVDFTTARELFAGTDSTHFTPNAAMTRGMMATVLFRLDGENKGQTANHFTDVADSWYTDAVAWAAEAGVVNGYGNGTFLPEKSINREELAVMVYRYAKALGLGYAAGQEIPDLTYADADQVSEWAYEAISWLTANGVLNGKPGNVVDAAGLASRAEVSAVLERFVKLAK